MDIKISEFGSGLSGNEIKSFTITNSERTSFSLINFGGILTSFRMKNSNNKIENVILGFENIEKYIDNPHYFGATIGRFSNRIASGRFSLNGKVYTLECNEEFQIENKTVKNHEHGGSKGFHTKIWNTEPFCDELTAGVCLRNTFLDRESGYPGNLEVSITISLNESNELIFDYNAKTDIPTPVSMTNHAYWNLEGAGSGSILNHELRLNCSTYLPLGEDLIPTGEIKNVDDGPMDFRTPKKIGRDMKMLDIGYDHCYIADSEIGELSNIARLSAFESGRIMEVLTTMPAVQVYTANYLDGIVGADNVVFNRHDAVCLETEYYPDSVNQSHFPSVILDPGVNYHHSTIHKFTIK